MSDFDAHQRETAEWMGTDVDTMNEWHDWLHEHLADHFGVKSHSLADRDGLPFDPKLSGLEENAVLHVQRWLHHMKALA